MRTYLISYDLANPNAKRHAIAEEIMEMGVRWARPLEQTWYITTQESEEDIEARIEWLLGDEDGLLIQAADDPALLTNTALRWFQQRPGTNKTAHHAVTNDNVITLNQAKKPNHREETAIEHRFKVAS